MVDKTQFGINRVNSKPSESYVKTFNSSEISFKAVLDGKLKTEADNLKLSKHAKERITQRGIDVSQDLMSSLNNAADIAGKKGAKDIVMISKDAAFVVNIENKIIITAVPSSELKENVFTNIDSAIII